MTERQTEVDSFNLSLQGAYNGFKELSQKYGQPPKEGMTMPTNSRVFSVDIPNNKNAHNHADNIGGRYFGPDTGTIEIFYRHKDVATQIILSKNSHGKVSIDQSVLFELVHTKTGYALHRHHGENLEPDINSLNELLVKAKEILNSPKIEIVPAKSAQRSKRENNLRRELALDLANLHSQRLQDEKNKRKKPR